MEKKWTVGICFLGILAIFIGCIGLINAVPKFTYVLETKRAFTYFNLGQSPLASTMNEKQLYNLQNWLNSFSYLVTFFSVLFSILLMIFEIICGVFLIKRKGWARASLIYLSSFFLAIPIMSFVFTVLNPNAVYRPTVFGVTSIVIALNFIAYLPRSKVKQQFKA